MKRFMLIMFIKLKVREETLFEKIEGDEDTIMGYQLKKLKNILLIINEKISCNWKSN